VNGAPCDFVLGQRDFASQEHNRAAYYPDAAALKRFMADDLQYAHAGGQKQTKEQYIAAVTNGPARYESFTFSDLKINKYPYQGKRLLVLSERNIFC
jgi:hypothetical protein